MARIGSFFVTVFRGYMPRARRRFRLKAHGGVDGDGVVFDAYHTGTVEIITRTLVPDSQAEALVEEYRAQQERHLSITDQFEDDYADVLVCDVVPSKELVVGDEAHVVAVWTLLPQALPPAGAL